MKTQKNRRRTMAATLCVSLLALGPGVGCPVTDILIQVQLAAQAVELGANLVQVVANIQDEIASGAISAEQGAVKTTVRILDVLDEASPALLEATINQAASLTGAPVTLNAVQAAAAARVIDQLGGLTEEQMQGLIDAGVSPTDPNVSPAELAEEIKTQFDIDVAVEDLEILIDVIAASSGPS